MKGSASAPSSATINDRPRCTETGTQVEVERLLVAVSVALAVAHLVEEETGLAQLFLDLC
jgi:hypothetical protein